MGYNYAGFGLPVELIDAGTETFAHLIEKTKRKRCDLFLGRYEVIVGFAQIGNDYITRYDLGTAPMPGVPGDNFYMMVSRQYEHAEDLRIILNAGIARLKSTGEDEELLRSYLNPES